MCPTADARSGAASVPAILVDGSSLFFAARALFPDRNLNYHALNELIHARVGSDGLAKPALLFSSIDPGNDKQQKFVEFIEHQLHWDVQRIQPHDATICNPLLTDSVFRSIRFDAWIAYALGRLAGRDEGQKVVVVSDSWSLAGPVQECAARNTSVTVCFFGSVIDTRWHKVFRDCAQDGVPVDFLDLDDDTEKLFNRAKPARGKEGHRLTLLD